MAAAAMTARTIALPEIVDERGRLMFGEEGRHIPFAIKRIFAIYEVRDGAKRGGHAHRGQEQFIVMLSGECRIMIQDGTVGRGQLLTKPTMGLYVPPVTWIELSTFSSGAVCLVLTSGLYDEADYIREYAEFEKLAQG
jgi:oxalate decarboxylase/phosphoglucose isomerase-like protein (cupin superfamily)